VSYGCGGHATHAAMTAYRGERASREELLQELAARHRDAFAWALNCCRRNRTEAEDVLQETYLKVLDGRARFDGRSTFTTWLFGVVRLTAAAQRRRRILRAIVSARAVAEESFHDPPPTVEAGVEASQRNAALLRALAALSHRQREIVVLVFYHDLTIEDAARVMAVSVGAARQHYARGKARLRLLLDDLEVAR